MEKISNDPRAKQEAGLTRRFAVDAARLLAETRCYNVVLLDARGLSPVTDYMLLATGTSPRQMETACDEIKELGAPRGFRALSRSGDGGQWTCIDLIDLVVHVFSQEARAYYNLDNLWGEARHVDWQNESAASNTNVRTTSN